MSHTRTHLVLFAVLCLAQLGAAGFAIVKHERTLAQGERFLFRVAPADPEDPFRGRYLQIGFPAARMELTPPPGAYERVYAVIERGPDGFARFSMLRTDPPDGAPYLTTRIAWISPERVQLDLPFARYYEEETIARRADEALAKFAREGGEGAHVAVRVLAGHAVLEELYLGGVPLRERLASLGAKPGDPSRDR